VVPSYLNELSPDDVRGTLPGFAYQLGNLIAAGTAYILAWVAQSRGGDFAFAQSAWIFGVALVLALLAWFGPEARGVAFGPERGGNTDVVFAKKGFDADLHG
jgi:SHS family lactate transporter-like MFS transporter